MTDKTSRRVNQVYLEHLQGPEHFDSSNHSDIGVVKVIEGAESEGTEDPDKALCQIGDEGAPVEDGRSDVVDENGFKT